jgi:hypothetical protein
VNFVETNDTSFQLFVVSCVMQRLIYIILEFLFVGLLLIKFLSEILHFICETFLSHSEIIHNKSKVLIDSIKVL